MQEIIRGRLGIATMPFQCFVQSRVRSRSARLSAYRSEYSRLRSSAIQPVNTGLRPRRHDLGLEGAGRGALRTSALARLSKRLAREIKRTTRFVTTSGRKPP